MLLLHIPVDKMREAAAAWRAADRGRNSDLHDKVDDLIAEVDSLRREAAEMRTALKAFCEADWYADGFGKFEGKVAGTALDRAKSLL